MLLRFAVGQTFWQSSCSFRDAGQPKISPGIARTSQTGHILQDQHIAYPFIQQAGAAVRQGSSPSYS
jgi:hypothetical protein